MSQTILSGKKYIDILMKSKHDDVFVIDVLKSVFLNHNKKFTKISDSEYYILQDGKWILTNKIDYEQKLLKEIDSFSKDKIFNTLFKHESLSLEEENEIMNKIETLLLSVKFYPGTIISLHRSLLSSNYRAIGFELPKI